MGDCWWLRLERERERVHDGIIMDNSSPAFEAILIVAERLA
jgi:hypothetical protein